MPHALHMPSHTFIAVSVAGVDRVESERRPPPESRLGAGYALDYLVYAYLQGARGTPQRVF
jgi:hypothetical protein